jgi:hypothetical protein
MVVKSPGLTLTVSLKPRSSGVAFLLSGAGTSIGAITGALLIARRRVVGLVVGLLLAGAIILEWNAALILSG